MKVLILHNAYQQPGGEDAVVRSEAAMLRSGGCDVDVVIVSNHDIISPRDKAVAALRIGYNPARRKWMDELLASVRPDVVHIHNFFPLLTAAVHHAAADRGIAVIQTLHNYRLLCAAATFERGGAVCELCLGGQRRHALIHRCYRGSLPGTLAVTAMQASAHSQRGIIAHTTRFIALTEFARQKYIAGGYPPERLVVKPNFIPLDPQDTAASGETRAGALFVGRLVAEKGVRTLIEAWRSLPDVPLTIAGDGPLRAELEASAPPHVTFTGFVDSSRVRELMQQARALIMPSTWYEGFPVTLVEAMARGLPVLVSNLGSLAEVVSDGRTGLHFAPNDVADLARVARRFFAADVAETEKMGQAARVEAAEKYSEKENCKRLTGIYHLAISDMVQRRGQPPHADV